MSQPSRPKAPGAARRRRLAIKLERVTALEERALLAPVISINTRTATFTPAATPTNANLGTVTVTTGAAIATSAAPFTSVAQLTPSSSFGGDIVRIEAGPGGDFGKGVYAISRGAGENTGAINRPGVIYRVDPATGKSSVFFDLNTVLSQLEPGGTAGNSNGAASGLVNWYDIAFDPEGYFDGRTSMFVSSVDRTDGNKNVIFRIGPDGSFMGAFAKFDANAGGQFTRTPSAIFVPPPEQQTFLRGLISGDGASDGGFAALAFDANGYRPGTDLTSTTGLPAGVSLTNFTFGPQVGFAAANTDYASRIYSAFTDFGTPAAGGIPAVPGLSGVQGSSGGLLIGAGAAAGTGGTIVNSFTAAGAATPDTAAAIITPFRRFQDIAFDQYGYFSYGTTFTVNAAGTGATVGTLPPTFAGSLFVSDLATGLAVTVTPVAPAPVTPIFVPVSSTGTVSVTIDPTTGLAIPSISGGTPLGGRIVRIDPLGNLTPFAENFHVSAAPDASSFIASSLSITFSADGTTLYASDDDGIWQFKTVTSLASSTTGSLVGLNDLRTLGVPYEGQDSAVAVVDTGVDALTPPLRGRVSTGTNTFTGGSGNDDLTSTAFPNGHGTLVAGVIAQFVPQATIDPINVFSPASVIPGGTTAAQLYNGMDYLTKNPFVKDPVRPNKNDRVIAANFGFGTTSTFDTEGTAYRKFPQIVIALKNELKRFRSLGIAPVAAAGQLGTPTGSTTTTATLGDVNGMALPAILNEAISVTGTYPFPFSGTATSGPNDPGTGVVPRPVGPVLLFGNGITITGLTNQALVAGDAVIFKDKLLAASNRSTTTDFAAPAIDVPTFARTALVTTGTTQAAIPHNDFLEAGTSLSSAIVTGSFAVVSSALDYWGAISQSGVTSDAYLTQPVGARTLDFGPHEIGDLAAYANPDGVNAILQWTAVPAVDSPNFSDTTNPPTLFGSDQYRNFSRVDVGNAIAAIEGSIALNYLFNHNTFDIIDSNKNGLITAQEVQDFVDRSNTIGLPEAGAMARLLGGTARIPTTGAQPTAAGEVPDQPDVLQRRYNFFDYAADGQLNGAVSIDQLRLLSKKLLPAPDGFVINDRQRASNNGYLIDPSAKRNYYDLQHIKPTYAFVPKSAVAKFRGISVSRFGVGKKQPLNTITPGFTLFDLGKPKPAATVTKGGTKTPTTGAGKATGTGTTGGTTGALVTKPAQGTTVTGGTTTPTPSQTNQAYQQGLLNAVNSLANSNKTTKTSSTTKLGTPQPTGKLVTNGTVSTQVVSTGATSTNAGGAAAAKVESNVATTKPVKQAKTKVVHQVDPAHATHVQPKKKEGVFDYIAKIFK